MKKTIISALLAVCCLTSCVDLNIAPKNFVSDNDLMSSESGMNIYMARMYSYMPFEDFKYMAKWGLNFNSWLGALGIEGTRRGAEPRQRPRLGLHRRGHPLLGNGIHHAARCQLPARAAARLPEQLRRSHL